MDVTWAIPIVCLAIIFAIMTIEVRDLVHSILFFAVMSICIGALFFFLNATYVAVFQLLIYAGAVVALFLAAIMLTARREVR